MYSLFTVDTFDIQHNIVDYESVTYSNHYSEEGSGFGFLTFTLHRLYGRNYEDIGFGYGIELHKGLKKPLFKGIITKIEEATNNEIVISAVGLNTLTSFDILNFVLADNRVNRWTTACNPRGSYRPDKFDHSLSWVIVLNEGQPDEEEVPYDGIQITPRRGVDYTEDDYYYIRYRFEFGETAKRLTGTYQLALPNNWPGKVEIFDADENVIWSSDVSGNGSLDLDLDASYSGTFVEIRFTVTVSGLNTAEDETVYFRLWDVLVLSTDETLDAAIVLTHIAEHMYDNYDFSNDYSLIDTIGFEIPQAAYDADEELNKIANNACSFGDSNAKPLAWGVAFDDTLRMFLQKQDLTTIRYLLALPEDTRISGDIAESFQKAYGVYTDVYGQTQRTDEVTNDTVIDKIGLYRKQTIKLDKEMTTAQAGQAVQLALNENSEPKIRTSFRVGDLTTTPFYGIIPIDELRSGGLVQVPDLRAQESSTNDDDRKGYHTFMLKKVEISLDEQTATLTPADDLDTFETYMETLRRLV
jgi:hypothetical protein